MWNDSLSILVVFLQKACTYDGFSTISTALSFICQAHTFHHNYLKICLLDKNPGRTVEEQSILMGKIHKILIGFIKLQEGSEPLIQQSFCFSCSQLHVMLLNTADELKYSSCAQIVTDRNTLPLFLHMTWNIIPKQIIAHFFRVCNKPCTWHHSGDPSVKGNCGYCGHFSSYCLLQFLTRDNEANGHH